jgi:hypothetical protein
MNSVDQVVAALRSAPGPQSISEIAASTGLEPREVDRIVWGAPERFAWQPGHNWTLTSRRVRPRTHFSHDVKEARADLDTSGGLAELRAITLSSGLTIKVSRHPLDSDAFFSVRSAGNTLELVLNSTHELFGELPMPFRDDPADSPYRRLVEVLLEAWALYEDSVPGGPARRATQDTRLLWGRRALEVLRESE